MESSGSSSRSRSRFTEEFDKPPASELTLNSLIRRSFYPAHVIGNGPSVMHLYENVLGKAREFDPIYARPELEQALSEAVQGSEEDDWECVRDTSQALTNMKRRAMSLPRLPAVAPPKLFQVVDGIYRSGFPDVLHLDIYELLGIKTILKLVDKEYPWVNKHFVEKHKVKVVNLPVVSNDLPDIKVDKQTVNTVMSYLMHAKNHPIVIHCDNGLHQTGCMVGCFRKLQAWADGDIVKEYRLLAGDLARPLDESFILGWAPSRVMMRKAVALQIAAWQKVNNRLINAPDGRVFTSSNEEDMFFKMDL